MHIKSLTLRGFLCYKETTTIVFDPRLNVIVGSNGSGKSSLLSAIQFAMGVEAPSDRLLCLHHGASSKVLVGYVILVLDNSDGRMTGLEKGDVAIRREFSAQRDELTLNGKRVTRQELLSLLEAVGFSRSNPYYFTHQHEVSGLARMQNAERLKTLKECAGTRVYDDRRAEAVRSLEETRSRRKTIDSMLEMITSRVNELREEQDELQECLSLEKDKQCLTAILAGRELKTVSEQLDTLRSKAVVCEDTRNRLSEQIPVLATQLEQLQFSKTCELAKLKTTDEGLTACQMKQRKNERSRERQKQLLDQLLQKQREKVALIETKSSALETLLRTKVRLQEEIAELEKRETDWQHDIQKTETKLLQLQQQLYHQESRRGTASSVVSSKGSMGTLDAQLEKRLQDVKSTEILLQEARHQAQDADQQWHKVSAEIASLNKELHVLRLSPTNEQASPTICWKDMALEPIEATKRQVELEGQLSTLRRTIATLKLDVSHQTQKLHQLMRPSQLQAYLASYDWAEQKKTQKQSFYGSLLDNIKVDAKFYAAVEAAGGNQLFNLLLSNKHVATELVTYLRETAAGSAVVTPLEDLTPSPEVTQEDIRIIFPTAASLVVPLISVIESTSELRPAVRQIFGRFILIQSSDLDLAASIAAKGFDCVTLEGELVSKKGTLTGGYRAQATRLATRSALSDAEESLSRASEELQNVTCSLRELLDAQASASANASRIRAEHDAARERQYYIMNVLNAAETERDQCHRRSVSIQTTIAGLQAQLELLNEEIQRLDPAMQRTDSNSTSTAEELSSVRSLKNECNQLSDNLSEKKRQLEKLHETVARRRAELDFNVVNQISIIETSLRDLHNGHGHDGTEDGQAALGNVQVQCDILDQEAALLAEDRHRLEQERSSSAQLLESLERQIQEVENRMEQTEKDEAALSSELKLLQSELEPLRVRAEILETRQQSLSESSERLNSLTFLPDSDIVQQLSNVNLKLQRYESVNRKAVDQFSNFVEEEQKLLNQRKALYKAEDAIGKLLTGLDEQKETTLLKTFENVNSQFSQVFRELVPDGKAKLVLKKLTASNIFMETEDGDEPQNALDYDQKDPNRQPTAIMTSGAPVPAGEDVITGVGIKVRFPTTRGYIPLETLSGGQKSTVALALMFALQRVEASPFYIMDEIDANLDVQYRGAVAQLIQRQAETHQIIVISHRAPMIRVGHWFLKTELIGQVTRVTSTTLTDALAVSQTRSLPTGNSTHQHILRKQPFALAPDDKVQA